MHFANLIEQHLGMGVVSAGQKRMRCAVIAEEMPAGIPVATVAIGKAGATNAGILAAQIIGLSDGAIADKLRQHKQKLADGVEEKSRKLKQARSK